MRKINLSLILSNEACQICGRLTKIVCNECLADNRPAGFCERHQELHKKIMPHVALWGELCK